MLQLTWSVWLWGARRHDSQPAYLAVASCWLSVYADTFMQYLQHFTWSLWLWGPPGNVIAGPLISPSDPAV